MGHMGPCLYALLLAVLAGPGAQADCVPPQSLGKCAPCTKHSQCAHGRFCCPFLKKCVKNSYEACGYPIASCLPPCQSDNPADCQCQNPDFPNNWVQCTSGDAGHPDTENTPNPITSTLNWRGRCVGWYQNTWCYLVDEHGHYARSGQPWQCSSFKGFSAEEWCYRPGRPHKGDDISGGAVGETKHQGSTREETTGDVPITQKFHCPSQWYFGSAPTEPQAEEWTMAHNVFRCMHDVPFVQWSNPVADDIKNWLADKQFMVHSACYDVKPPAGPAGENLFSGSPPSYFKPAAAVSNWYSEVGKCPSLPGCGGSFSMGTGHFTAMVWEGVKFIGCTGNRFGLKGCRYKGGDGRDCTNPNMGGCYHANVPASKHSLASCKAKVQQCFGGKALPGNIEAFDVAEGAIGAMGKPLRVSALLLVAAGLPLTLLLVTLRCRSRRREQYLACSPEEALVKAEGE